MSVEFWLFIGLCAIIALALIAKIDVGPRNSGGGPND